MSDVTLYRFPLSTYIRTARIALAEKGVAYEHMPFDPTQTTWLPLTQQAKYLRLNTVILFYKKR